MMVEDGKLKTPNDWADYWRYQIGVNVIPADTRNKKTWIRWQQWQDKPIPLNQHEEWKEDGSFNKGMAVILGRVWHNENKTHLFLAGIDCDNSKAISEVCTYNGNTSSPLEFAHFTIVEQHRDNPDKAHIYFYTTRPVPKKSSDVVSPQLAGKVLSNEVPAIEVKGLGEHGIMYCTPAVHQKGCPYEILDTLEPAIIDDLEQHIDNVCRKYGIAYLDRFTDSNNNIKARSYNKSQVTIQEMCNPTYKVFEGHNRHEALLRIMESMIIRNKEILGLDKVRQLAEEWNNDHCSPPLDDAAVEKQWMDSLKFVEKIRENDSDQVKMLTERLLQRYRFCTMKDTSELYYYNQDRGIYTSRGESLVGELCEEIFPNITSHQVNEIVQKIKRRTSIDRSRFDATPHILNVQNGMLDILTYEFKPHSPDYLSLMQLPIIYDPKAKCPHILRFLGQVLRPRDIFTFLEVVGSCLYKNAKYEKATALIGSGGNGKTTVLKVLEAFLGSANVSHVSLQALSKDRFSAADLYGKLANIYADLGSEKLMGTELFKMLVTGDRLRGERKFQQPFDFNNYAKLIFSANKIPESPEDGYAYYRRWIILPFEKTFSDSEKDTNLIDNLTTDQELSGLLNLTLIALKKLTKDNGFKYIDDVRTIQKAYKNNASTVQAFLDEKCIFDTLHEVLVDGLYSEYVQYCRAKNQRPIDKISLGLELAHMGIEKDRIQRKGRRDYYYIGIALRSSVIGTEQSTFC